MSFFDKKTEVISIELTQYGKHLLSKGKFKPFYYEFYDNDVVYDSEYSGITEERNNAQERIKNETNAEAADRISKELKEDAVFLLPAT
jgi:hypothetical protein